MEHLKRGVQEIMHNIEKVVSELDEEQFEKFIARIKDHNRIFVHGAGRSGLVGQSFAMRLMHLGFTVHVIGETTTPSITSDSLLIAISGSGQTASVVSAAEISKEKGAEVAAVTSSPESPLAELADTVIEIRCIDKEDGLKSIPRDGESASPGDNDPDRQNLRYYLNSQVQGKHRALTPMGTLFEDACLVFLDGVVLELMKRTKTGEESMLEKHVDIE